MYPERILFGKFKHDHDFIIEYDVELALAGLPAYYVHRARYKGDGLKNQRTVSELPVPEPAIFVYDRDGNGHYYADVLMVATYEEALAFLPNISSAMTFEGSLLGELFGKFAEERQWIEREARIAHEDELAILANEKHGQMTLIFD